ncbi:hypothetical protein P4H61_01805 [Paenibacillus peoriae]|uniref:hypothetical protein n=1 Tax=Paenibacillus peoriae TaxID=59893 RepID=UPI001F516736|nr:hypothetical protein [Paenibacillus peoriae]MEC0180234.1 hypothetical protein [Paenibacillus peoriae]
MGTPSELVERLYSLQVEYDNDEFLLVTPIPDYEQRLYSYQLITEAVHASCHSK